MSGHTRFRIYPCASCGRGYIFKRHYPVLQDDGRYWHADCWSALAGTEAKPTYVCTHCGWAGTEPGERHGDNYWCPRCPYLVIALAVTEATP